MGGEEPRRTGGDEETRRGGEEERRGGGRPSLCFVGDVSTKSARGVQGTNGTAMQ